MLVTTRAPVARWNALGTYAFLMTDDPAMLAPAQELAREVLDEVDRTCSRFRSDSDLSRANATPGRWVAVDPLLVAAVDVAVQAARVTDGLVDPCLGRSMVLLGYDADLDVVRRRRVRPDLVVAPPPRDCDAWRRVGLDPEGAVRVPAGSSLDLGATAKAWAGDLVAASVVDRLGCHVVVSLGGDIRADGPAGTSHVGWPVSISERPDEEEQQRVSLGSGGIATSSTLARRWATPGGDRHHLLDPRTGLPTAGPWRTVTASAPTCVAANTASTAALVLGEGALRWLRRHRVSARLVSRDGSLTTVGGWPGPDTDEPTLTTKDRRP